ncbi:winged helix-turn-helix domain-containing protein [Paenibacillus ginsengarvi]|uniref:DNA topoisomerase (ATP-hydrolyzing) n=1 Tax=Paenibacillus ginsengarvi TaxID=400777 RepID=A0A3B0CEP7_9BACL|nr:winged helix-turn-helix domain-containing protein [Paenibacillus ginsengarvi]RKN83972.1 ArsR family transcriptional regulator [Paenibacillus ginsengarvi]
MNRDYGAELDMLKKQMEELERAVRSLADAQRMPLAAGGRERPAAETELSGEVTDRGVVYFSGHYPAGGQTVRFDAQERKVDELLGIHGEKAAKVLAAIGHKQRLDLLLAVWEEPLTGVELVEKLGMGTTGQLYHHLKALTGADLLVQEERGGRYTIPSHRRFQLLLLLAAVSDLIETSNFIDMTEARGEAHAYLGAAAQGGHDIHQLLLAVVDNSVLEHEAGYCSEVRIYVHDDGSATVTDNGRGIPVRLLPQTGKPAVQSVLTELERLAGQGGKTFLAPGAAKGISIAVVNALSRRLGVEVRRDGGIFRQEYRYGIPQSGLLSIGETNETGTSITFQPDPELFHGGFDADILAARAAELEASHPGLRISVR